MGDAQASLYTEKQTTGTCKRVTGKILGHKVTNLVLCVALFLQGEGAITSYQYILIFYAQTLISVRSANAAVVKKGSKLFTAH